MYVTFTICNLYNFYNKTITIGYNPTRKKMGFMLMQIYVGAGAVGIS